MLELICFNIFLHFIWLNTNAFYEYIKYVPFIKKYFCFDNYKIFIENNDFIIYPDYLKLMHQNFFIKLITCPFCLGFWMLIPQYLIFNFNFFLVYILIMSGYKIFARISNL